MLLRLTRACSVVQEVKSTPLASMQPRVAIA